MSNFSHSAYLDPSSRSVHRAKRSFDHIIDPPDPPPTAPRLRQRETEPVMTLPRDSISSSFSIAPFL